MKDDPTSQGSETNPSATEHPLESHLDKDPADEPNRPSNHETHSAQSTPVHHNPRTEPDMISPPGSGISIQQPAVAAQKTSSSDPDQPEQVATRCRERLGVARTTFETIEAISGTIPVVGSYVGAGAKVGLVVVQMIQGMDGNKEMVTELETRIEGLSDLLGHFKSRSVENRREEFLGHLIEIQSELNQYAAK